MTTASGSDELADSQQTGSSGTNSGAAETATPTGKRRFSQRLHPLGWVAVGFLAISIVATIAGWDLLIGQLPPLIWIATAGLVALSAFPKALHRIRLGIEWLSDFGGKTAVALAWIIFFVQMFNVVTRYTNNWFERDILFGQTTSMAWMAFALLFLAGVGYGVKDGINPRIDFWWADFSPRLKAAIDFTLHTFLFLPFMILALRVLRPYAAQSLGYNRFANGGEGAWPEGWAVWRTWETSINAGELPRGPIQALILVGFALWTAQVVAEIIKSGFVLIGREDLGLVNETDAIPLRIE